MKQHVRRANELLVTEGPTELVRGIRDFLSHRAGLLYWRLKSRVSPDLTSVEVGGVTCEFVTETYREQRRAETLMGEREVLDTLVSMVSADDIVWDIGGSWGMFAVPMAATGAEVSVFEPVPNRVARIERNLAVNDLEATVNQFALGAERQELTLDLEGENPGGLTDDADVGVAATVRPGDSVFDGGGQPPTVLKIDVEGAEADVLDGLERTLEREACCLVVIEVHRDFLPQFDATESDVSDRLEAAGFAVDMLTQRNEDNYHLIATK